MEIYEQQLSNSAWAVSFPVTLNGTHLILTATGFIL